MKIVRSLFLLNIFLLLFSCSKDDAEISDPKIVSYHPEIVSENDIVTIVGENLAAPFKLELSGIEVSIISSSSTEIKFKVPSNLNKAVLDIMLESNNFSFSVGDLKIKNTKYLVASNRRGNLYELNIVDGRLTNIGEYVEGNVLNLSHIADNKDFIYYAYTDNVIHRYNKKTKEITYHQLEIPNELEALGDTFIEAITWNRELKTIVAEAQIENSDHFFDYVVTIDPDTFSITNNFTKIIGNDTFRVGLISVENSIYFNTDILNFPRLSILNFMSEDQFTFNGNLTGMANINSINGVNKMIGFQKTLDGFELVSITFDNTSEHFFNREKLLDDLFQFPTSIPFNSTFNKDSGEYINFVKSEDGKVSIFIYNYNEGTYVIKETNYPTIANENLRILSLIH